MRITHHPDQATLMSYAAGSLAEPLAAVVAAHAAMCPDCRRDVAMLEMVGGLLVERIGATPLTRPPPGKPQIPASDSAIGSPIG